MTIIILWSMTIETDIRCGNVHLVFVAKYRRKIFDLDAIEKLRSYFASIYAEMDGERAHVHLLINDTPKLANSFKGASSRPPSRDRPGIAQHYYAALKDGVLLCVG